jgi:hypothetical protein
VCLADDRIIHLFFFQALISRIKRTVKRELCLNPTYS